MKSRSNLLFTMLLLFPIMMVRGQANEFQPARNSDLLSEKIAASNQGIESLQCDFEQEKALSFLEEKVFSSGKFYFQKENKIRWEYKVPYSYIIIMNGSLIRIEDEGKTNTLDASSNRLFGSINSIMAGIIDGSVIRQQEQFKSTFFENTNAVRISLEPLTSGMKEFIASIELDLNKSDYTVDALKIIEKTGDYTLIVFKNKELNAPVAESIFNIH